MRRAHGNNRKEEYIKNIKLLSLLSKVCLLINVKDTPKNSIIETDNPENRVKLYKIPF
jgi:hypothetical protein